MNWKMLIPLLVALMSTATGMETQPQTALPNGPTAMETTLSEEKEVKMDFTETHSVEAEPDSEMAADDLSLIHI